MIPVCHMLSAPRNIQPENLFYLKRVERESNNLKETISYKCRRSVIV